MALMKSKELKKYNLPEDRILLGLIDAKPNTFLFLFFLIGLALVATTHYTVGAFITGVSTMAFMVLPRRILIEFYENYLVLYNHAGKNDCEMIYYEDVVKWRYNYGISYDELQIILTDNSTHTIDAYSKVEYETLMNRFLKDKKDKTKRSKGKN